MYTFNPKTLERDVENFNHKDFSKNKIKYDKLEKLTDFEKGGNLMIARVPNDAVVERNGASKNGSGYRYYLISTLGAELGEVINIEKYNDDLNAFYEKLKEFQDGSEYQKHLLEQVKYDYYECICEPLISAVANETKLVAYVPDELFNEYPDIGDKIIATKKELLSKSEGKKETKSRKKSLEDTLNAMGN